jgi:hypothetical protein
MEAGTSEGALLTNLVFIFTVEEYFLGSQVHKAKISSNQTGHEEKH